MRVNSRRRDRARIANRIRTCFLKVRDDTGNVVELWEVDGRSLCRTGDMYIQYVDGREWVTVDAAEIVHVRDGRIRL